MSEEWRPETETAKSVYLAGFGYDATQDILYSRMDAWQRDFGYAHAYDLAAPVSISAVIDCESFFFKYKGVHWMIELWKGQYGLETGAEIGVYFSPYKRPLLDSTIGRRPHDKKNGKFYDCAGDDRLLELSFSLKRNGETLFSRDPERHWWLTGFKWGVLSDPDDLTMELSIGFPDTKMKDAFLKALRTTGYERFSDVDNTVAFVFSKPKTYQPRKDPDWVVFSSNAKRMNQSIVSRYKELSLSNNDPNNIQGPVAEELASYFGSYDPKQLMDSIAGILPWYNKKASRALADIFGGHSAAKESRLKKFLKKLFG